MTVNGSLPHTAVVDADVKDVRLPGHSGSADGSTTTMRTDAPPSKVLIEVRIELLGGG
jgi:hypothetical protein